MTLPARPFTLDEVASALIRLEQEVQNLHQITAGLRRQLIATEDHYQKWCVRHDVDFGSFGAVQGMHWQRISELLERVRHLELKGGAS